jgi:hypothetical protein
MLMREHLAACWLLTKSTETNTGLSKIPWMREHKMRKRDLVTILAAGLLIFFSTATWAATDGDRDEDTDTRLVNAKVVEVSEARISVIAQTGVEHVIAIDRADTKVTIDGEVVSVKDVREGDVITVELDAQNPIKFAKNILMRSDQIEVARNRR